MMAVNRQEGKPLVIQDSTALVVDVRIMSHKAFTKSTEHGELWVVHAETGRVLPYEGSAGRVFTVLEDKGPWYRAVLASHDSPDSSREDDAHGTTVAAPNAPKGTAGSLDVGGVLAELAAVIERRKKERPQGSYTTYLFDAGEEKIRKKTGEEAIELVLARSRSETVSEAADLVYHLLVLLNQLDIPFEAVVEELHGRA